MVSKCFEYAFPLCTWLTAHCALWRPATGSAPGPEPGSLDWKARLAKISSSPSAQAISLNCIECTISTIELG